jgi:hypothetical protein
MTAASAAFCTGQTRGPCRSAARNFNLPHPTAMLATTVTASTLILKARDFVQHLTQRIVFLDSRYADDLMIEYSNRLTC